MLKYERIKLYMRHEAQKPSSVLRMPTVRELSRRFSVSTSTVLRALQDLEHERVIMRRHGSGIVSVRPNSEIGILEESGSVDGASRGLVVYAPVDYPSETVWRTNLMVEQGLRNAGYCSVCCRLQCDTTISDLCAFASSRPSCCGLIIFGLVDMLSDSDLALLGDLPFPVVLLDHQCSSYGSLPSNCGLFTIDSRSAARETVSYLHGMGHRRIGYVRNEPNSDYHQCFLRHFGRCMSDYGLDFGPDRVFSGSVRPWEDALSMSQQLIRCNLDRIASEGLTALVFASSLGAFAAIEPLRLAGYRVPEDISVMGEGDIRILEFSSPALTVVSADYWELVSSGIGFISGGGVRQVFVKERVIERMSVIRR